MMTIYYEIRIAGLVPPGALRGFEQLSADQRTETMVHGSLPDQAAMQGLLARLESSGVQLMGLHRHKQRPSARGFPPSAGRPAASAVRPAAPPAAEGLAKSQA